MVRLSVMNRLLRNQPLFQCQVQVFVYTSKVLTKMVCVNFLVQRLMYFVFLLPIGATNGSGLSSSDSGSSNIETTFLRILCGGPTHATYHLDWRAEICPL